MKIIVEEVVGSNAISMQSGRNLYEKIHAPLIASEHVELDFSGVELFASPFFNASIGLLLQDIKLENLQRDMNIINLSTFGRQLLNLVIENAIKYYAMDAASDANLNEIIKNSDD
ncbi:MAG: hypothetical protein COB22_03235 [Cycloclasticus sp.]|nr:MAG: hypothetical protein COB22_03235 [Cycloclasticus sp.]